MAFLAPAFVGALGLTGTAATIGTALVGTGLSLAMGAVARSLSPRPGDPRASAGHRVNMRLDPNAPREIGVGLFASAGTLVYRNVYNKQEYLEFATALSDYRCAGLVGLVIDGIERTWNPSTGAVSGYPGMQVRFHDGSWDQEADAGLIAHSGGRWTENHRGRGVCYAVVQMKFDAKTYPNGVPNIMFIVQGAPLYDWRKDSTRGGAGSHRWDDPETHEWTRNPYVIAYNWLTGLYLNDQRTAGMNSPLGLLSIEDWTAAANACDETVALKAGGTEPRYVVDGLISTSSAHREVLRAIVTATAGELVDTGGLLRPLPGVSQASVLSITDDDLMEEGEVEIVDKLSRNDLVNAVFGTFNDPGQQYESTAAPPRISPDDEAADGGIRLERHYALDLVTSPTQAQRVLEILRRKGRYQATAKLVLRARCTGLEAGDVISWTSARYGYVNKQWRVVTTAVSDDHGQITVALRETAAAIFAWSAGTDELDPQAPVTLPGGGGAVNTIDLTSVVAAIATSDGEAQTPYLGVSWTPPEDPSVVAIDLEYRRVGDSVALTDRILDPTTGGEFGILKAVQGNTSYEVRALPVTVPPRDGLTWSAWVAATTATEPTKVDVAVNSEVADGSITQEKIDEQTRLELLRASLKADVEGSVAAQIEAAYGWSQKVAEVAMQARLDSAANGAAIIEERKVRSDGDSAIAQQVLQAVTWIDENAAVVEEVIESLDGVAGRWGVTVAVIAGQKYITGAVRLDGDDEESTFGILVDNFYIGDPNVDGGVPKQWITAAQGEDEVYRFVIDGEILADTIRAGALQTVTLEAITGSFGNAYFDGFVRTKPGPGGELPNGETYIDFTNPRIRLRSVGP